MEYNLIGIDPSLISTGMVVNGKLFNYCRESDVVLKGGGLSKWFKLCDGLIELKFINFRNFESYSDGELIKLKDYDLITDMIISDIEKSIDKSLNTKVAIEGYNFGSTAGDLIDLVTFSTLLRKKLYDYITKDITVLSPTTLKQESCKMTYPPKNVGKKKEKIEWRNNLGMSGGNFTKREMFLSIVENQNWVDGWSNHCRSVSGDILDNKTIKKPYEDVNDAYLLWRWLNYSIGGISSS